MRNIRFEPITGSLSPDDRTAAIRRNYTIFRQQVAEGLGDWSRDCPYEIADWGGVLDDNESGAWQDIRSGGHLPLWPKLPVGELTISFGNPDLRIALLCSTDRHSVDSGTLATAAVLQATGWFVKTVTGSQCTCVMEAPEDVEERTAFVSQEYRSKYRDATLKGTLDSFRFWFSDPTNRGLNGMLV